MTFTAMPSSKRASFFQRKQSEKKKPDPKRRSLGGRMMEAQPIAPSKNGELTIGDLCRARGRVSKLLFQIIYLYCSSSSICD
jgi:hypothetical protein